MDGEEGEWVEYSVSISCGAVRFFVFVLGHKTCSEGVNRLPSMIVALSPRIL